MKNNYLSSYATRASAKTRKTKIYTSQQLSDLRALIESYFVQHHPDVELNTNEANYTPLVDAINKQQQKEVLKTRFVCDLYNGYDTSTKKSIAKIEAIEKYILQNLQSEKKQFVKAITDTQTLNEPTSSIGTSFTLGEKYPRRIRLHQGKNFSRSDYEYWINSADKNPELSKKIEIYNEALLEIPDNEFLLQNLSVLYSDAGRKEESLQCGLHALNLYPNNPDLHGNHALQLHMLHRDLDKAEMHFKKAIELQPEHHNNNAHYAWFLQSIKKDYGTAQKHYQIALKINPDNPVALLNYGLLLCFDLFNSKQGIAHLEKANRLLPNDATNLGNLALAYTTYEMDLLKAEKYFQIATELDPANPIKHANHAQLLFVLNKKKEALKSTEISRRYAKGNAELILETEFYLYAHCVEMAAKAKTNIETMLQNGVTDLNKNYSINIKTAIKNGHSDIPTLLKFAQEISGLKYDEHGQAILPKVV